MRSSRQPGQHPPEVPVAYPTYLVYKRYPELLRHLWKILKVIWQRERELLWRCAEGISILKRGGIEKHRPVLAHLNIEHGGEGFFLFVCFF